MKRQPKFSFSDRRTSGQKNQETRNEDILPERVGDNPVEFTPKSILRKSNSKFNNNNNPVEEDCSTSASSAFLVAEEQKQPPPQNEKAKSKVNHIKSEKPLLNVEEENLTSTSASAPPPVPALPSALKACGAKFPTKKAKEVKEGEGYSDHNNNAGSPELQQQQPESKQEKPKRTPEADPTPKSEGEAPSTKPSVVEKKATSSTQDSAKKSKSQRSKVQLLPEVIYSKIFSFLNQIELHVCTQVCRQWREYCDTFYNKPRTFNGVGSGLCSSKSRNTCRLFLTDQLLQPENRRFYKLYFYNVMDWQMKTIVCERPEEFQAGVRHMSKLHLVNVNLQWQTLIILLQSLPHLNTFTDTWSVHFQYYSCCSSMCHPNRNQGNISKLPEKLMLAELKSKYTRIKVFKLTRGSLKKELCAYFQIFARMMPFLEDFQFNVGPCDTTKDKVPKLREWFPEFFKIFHASMARLRKSFKKIRIVWKDEGLDSLFDNCVEALHKLEFPRLTEITLRMSERSMKTPNNLPQFVRFLNSFEWNPGKNKFLHLKVHVSPIFMTKDWMEMLYTVQSRIILRKLHVSLRFGVKLDDKQSTTERSGIVTDIFGNYVFFRGLNKLQVNIHQEGTQSLREVIPGIRTTYPNVESLEIRVGDTRRKKSFAFRDYSIISIAFNFNLITELRISDQPERKWDVLNCIWGSKERASLTYAYISKRDMVLLCEMLTRLKVLMLWANLIDLRDINFTGIKSKCYYLRNDGQYYVNKEQVLKEKREPSILNLKHLRLLSLRGLGKDVTDITCRYAFGGMPHLSYVELVGDTSITQAGRMHLYSRMRPKGCKVTFCRR